MLQTQFSVRATDLAESFRSTVGRLRVGPHGLVARHDGARGPLDRAAACRRCSTCGWCRRSRTCRRSSSATSTSATARRSCGRSHYVDAICRERFKQGAPLDPAQYSQFLQSAQGFPRSVRAARRLRGAPGRPARARLTAPTPSMVPPKSGGGARRGHPRARSCCSGSLGGGARTGSSSGSDDASVERRHGVRPGQTTHRARVPSPSRRRPRRRRLRSRMTPSATRAAGPIHAARPRAREPGQVGLEVARDGADVVPGLRRREAPGASRPGRARGRSTSSMSPPWLRQPRPQRSAPRTWMPEELPAAGLVAEPLRAAAGRSAPRASRPTLPSPRPSGCTTSVAGPWCAATSALTSRSARMSPFQTRTSPSPSSARALRDAARRARAAPRSSETRHVPGLRRARTRTTWSA